MAAAPDPEDLPARPGRDGDLRLRNLAALPGWLVTIGFIATVVWLTLTLREKGTEWGYPPWLQYLALLAFWAGGCVGFGHLLRYPCTLLRVAPDGALQLTRIWLGPFQRVRIPVAHVADVVVHEDRDSEGDPYFRTRLTLDSGHEVTVLEGHREDVQHAAAARLRAAIGMTAAEGRAGTASPRPAAVGLDATRAPG